MYKAVILGCENSHADTFLRFICEQRLYPDLAITGLYSDEPDRARRLGAQYGIPVASSYDAFVGSVDGVIITARHGDNHYKYAKPYLASGVPMFIDKPITISERDADAFLDDLRRNHVRVCGGSCCKHAKRIGELRETVKSGAEIYGGVLRAPINMENQYGGFFFYSQHLVETVCEVFGRYPGSVNAFQTNGKITVVFHYEAFDVTGVYGDGQEYFASVFLKNETVGGSYPIASDCFKAELDAFYSLLRGSEQPQPYEDLFSPVYILNAIFRSCGSHTEETVHYYGR